MGGRTVLRIAYSNQQILTLLMIAASTNNPLNFKSFTNISRPVGSAVVAWVNLGSAHSSSFVKITDRENVRKAAEAISAAAAAYKSDKI